MKFTLAATAGLLVLGACQGPGDWDSSKASRAAFGDAVNVLQTPSEPVLTENERFVLQVSGSGLFEVETSRLAVERNVSEPVRAFAQMMLDDHARASQEMRDLLRRKDIAAPAVDGPAQADELSRLGDEEFERAYLEVQRVSHEQAIRDLESCVADEQNADADRQAFAHRLLPFLRVHSRELDHIRLSN